MNRTLRATLTALAVLGCAVSTAAAMSRIKDLASIEGVRQNQLLGYGSWSGSTAPATRSTIRLSPSNPCKRCWNASASTSAASRSVPATSPRHGHGQPAAVRHPRHPHRRHRLRPGRRQELQGGTLLVTPLLGADGNVYAVAQGSLAIGGFEAEGQAAKIVRGVPTVGRLPKAPSSNAKSTSRLPRSAGCGCLYVTPISPRPSASRSRSTIISARRSPNRSTLRPCRLTLPKKFSQNVVAMLTEIEQLQVEPDSAAKIVIDERSGVIVIGRDVRVSTVAVAQGNLTVTISETRRSASPHRSRAAAPSWCRRTQVGVQEKASGSLWSRKACRCSRSSTGSMRSASGRATSSRSCRR